MDDFEEDFFSDREGAQRQAAKRLTKRLDTTLWQMTVNAPDWCVTSWVV